MVWFPAVKLLVESEAEAAVNGDVPKALAPSAKVIFPVGGPTVVIIDGATVAVRVTDSPKVVVDCDEASTTVVPS